MKNKLELEVDGLKEVYDIILKVDINNMGECLIYTKNQLNDLDEKIVYAGILKTSDDKSYLAAIEEDEVLEQLDILLMKLYENTNKIWE